MFEKNEVGDHGEVLSDLLAFFLSGSCVKKGLKVTRIVGVCECNLNDADNFGR